MQARQLETNMDWYETDRHKQETHEEMRIHTHLQACQLRTDLD